MSQSQISQAAEKVDQTASSDSTVRDSQKATDCCIMSNVSEISDTDSDKLSFDWETCETLQVVKAFPISDYGTKLDDLSSSQFLVPEPPSLSGIIDSTVSSSSSSETTDVEEKYVEDDMSSLSNISEIKVSEAPRKHTYGKERVEREGNIYDKICNACLKGHISIVNDILKNCRTTLLPDEDGQTPLYAACIGNHLEVVNLLVDAGYDINHQDKDGKTPLHVAFENNESDLANYLITQYCANTEIRDKENWTPLHTAIDRGYYNYSQHLAQFLCQDVGTEVSWIQLQAACFQENTKYVKFLLDAKTNVNHNSSAGHSPLHIAVTKSNINIINLLLDQNVDINNKTIDCKTPLHIAVENGEETIIQTLLAQDADTNLKDALGNTVLHLAVQSKYEIKPCLLRAGVSKRSLFPASHQLCSIQTVQKIIEHGANVNAVNSIGLTPLWFACSDGQEQLVKILLEKGADPNIADKNNDNSLHAVMYGQCSAGTTQEVMHHCVNINAANKDGATPLLLACSTAQAESVRLLLEAKADPNIADADGDACLHAAIAAGCSKGTLQEIIDNGGDVNAVNNRGRTALLMSCSFGQIDSVNVLLGAGADPTLADEKGISCLHAAIDGRCNKETFHALLDHGVHIDTKTKDGTNALLSACRREQSEVVRFLLEAGADVNASKPDGDTILHVAVSSNCSKETLQCIMHHGAVVNAVNSNNETALFLACGSGQEESVKVLLNNAADPNIPESAEGYRSLHAAVHGNCNSEILQEIANKAYVDAQTVYGETALFFACLFRQQNSVKVLLKTGADPNIATAVGKTSLHAAVTAGCSKKIIQAIIKHGADVNVADSQSVTPLLLACERGALETINVLINAGAHINITDSYGETWIHWAMKGNCSKETLRAIISHGTDINTANDMHCTPLMLACMLGKVEYINQLLHAGADIEIRGFKGATCIHHAIGRIPYRIIGKDILQTIIDHGADVNATDNHGKTALMEACEMRNVDAINILLDAGIDTNISDSFGNTCLHYAVCGFSSDDLIQRLLKHGAALNAIYHGTQELIKTESTPKCLVRNAEAKKIPQNARVGHHITDAFNTCNHHTTDGPSSGKETLQSLIDRGVDVNATNKHGETALMIACHKGNVEVINVLLNAGANSNITDDSGETCIHHACSKETLQAIISHGADVNAVNNNGKTALMKACKEGDTDAINVLVNAEADLNIKDTMGCTLIHKQA